MFNILILSLLLTLVIALNENTLTDFGLTDACSQLPDEGRCTGQQVAWNYDPASDKCSFFFYTGCGGNANRYLTPEDCERACQQCPELDCPKGCHIKNSGTVCPTCQCSPEKARSMCGAPIDAGRCRSLMPMWGWVTELGDCQPFVYGGCVGNDNRFNTKHLCLSICKHT